MGLVSTDDGWRMPDWLWGRIEPLVPPPAAHPLGTHRRGLPKRQVMDAILLVLRTGMQWNALWSAAGLLPRSCSSTRLSGKGRGSGTRRGVCPAPVVGRRRGGPLARGFRPRRGLSGGCGA